MSTPAPARAANQAVRVFLGELGKEYDKKRGYKPMGSGEKTRATIKSFFNSKCCYCGTDLGKKWEMDHLIPSNKSKCGLHAWGNVVPACTDCNNRRSDVEWEYFLTITCKNDAEFDERYKRINDFVAHYNYDYNDPETLTEIRKKADKIHQDVVAYVGLLVTVTVDDILKSPTK